MRVLLTVVATIVLILIGALGVTFLGLYDVAATNPDIPVVKWWLHTTMEYSVERRAEKIQVPKLGSPEQLRAGFEDYEEDCDYCHQAPGVPRTDVAKGMDPEPPNLAKEAMDFSAAEIFWIIKHGIKMTGMPAWGPSRSDHEIWALVSFVKRLPKLTPAQYKRMQAKAAEDF